MTSDHNANWLQAIVLIFCLGLTYLSFSLVHKVVQTRSQENFEVLVEQSLTSLDRRFEEYSRTLDGVAGFILASDRVTATDMSNYASALDILDSRFVVDAIGFASAVPVDNTPGNAEMSAAQFIVQHIEPRASHETFLGLDFSSNPALLAVAKAARDTGQTLTAAHIPDSQSDHPQAFLLKPIYKPAQNANVPDQQKGDFLGFAFVIFNLDNAFKGLTTTQDTLIELRAEFDRTGAEAAYNTSEVESLAISAAPEFTVRRLVEKFGRTASLTWTSTPYFDQIQPFRARWVVLAMGLLVTVLISFILRVLIRKNRTITAIVAQKTRDLETQGKEKRSILDNAMLSFVSVNASGEILHSNQAALKLLMPRNGQANLTGQSLRTLLPNLNIHGKDGCSKIHLSSTLPNGAPSTIEIEKATWFTADGETRVTLLMRDITVSERHAQEIFETEQRWNLALMGAQIGVFDIDLQRETSVVSDTWRETLQIDMLPNCKNPYRQQMDRMHPDDLRLLRKAEAACIEGSTTRAEARFRVKVANDEWRWIKSDAVVVERAPDGTALRMLGIQMDVTESYKLEQLKRDFVATVSHELRTPLTSIKGALGLLQAQLQSAQPRGTERLIQIAASNSDRLVSLVNDILDMEKLNAGSMSHDAKKENLSQILSLASEQVETYASQWRVALEVVEPDVDQSVWTDKKRIMQVLTNLLSNACKFAHTDTTVRVTAEALPTCMKISVSNFGPGIPEEFRSKIFQPFSQADNSDTRHRGGTGLGLNISRQMIEAMGGTIGFESAPGKETVFWFTCPLVDGSEIDLAA